VETHGSTLAVPRAPTTKNISTAEWLYVFLFAHTIKQICRVPRLPPVILATQEAEIRRTVVQSQPGKIVLETLSQKHPSQKKGWWSGSR
jgi:hypothetical protein